MIDSAQTAAPRPASGARQPHRPLRIDAEVVRNAPEVDTSPHNRRMVLRCPDWPGFEPGQFAMLSAGAHTQIARWDPLLPRPMAIYRTRAYVGQGGQRDGADVEILYKVTGRGTGLLAEAVPGQQVRLVGPLGRAFPMPERGQRALLVGGGTGIASLHELAARARASGPVEVLLGARSESELMGRADFEALDVDLRIASEDGSAGTRGLVTELLEQSLAGGSARDALVYACGPTPMMRACAEIAAQHARRCLVSLENTMACGFGVCLGCAVPLSRTGGGGVGLVCCAGPVFEGHHVDWDGLP